MCNLAAQARSLPKDQFKREVEKELTGRESDPWEIIYVKLYKTQIPVVEQAIETAALMLGTDNGARQRYKPVKLPSSTLEFRS